MTNRRRPFLLRLASAALAASAVLSSAGYDGYVHVQALDNGFTTPPMGWSTWYGNLWHIDETLIREMADAMVSSGLRDLGYRTVWLDDGVAVGRDRLSRKLIVDHDLFPSGMRSLSDYLHERGLLFGVYTSKGDKTCMGYSKRPNMLDRPETGSCGYEDIDAETYAKDWQIDLLKNDGCGGCTQHGDRDPHAVMRDALNKTGRPIYYAVHNSYDAPHDDLGNDWRTGIDLCCPWYELWLNLLDKATTAEHRGKVGPGSFANPDFLQVGWSMAKGKHRPDFPQMSPLERRSHYTMWAALPAPLILGAELRPGKEWGGIYDPYTFETLTNPEVIAVNQDPLARPMYPVMNDEREGVQVWAKPLSSSANGGGGGGGRTEAGARSTGSESAGGHDAFALVLFHRSNVDASDDRDGKGWHTPRPDPPSVKTISVGWNQLGHRDCAAFEVRDLWAKRTLGVFCGAFGADVEEREARIYKFTRVGGARATEGSMLATGASGLKAAGTEMRCGCPGDEVYDSSSSSTTWSPLRKLAFGFQGARGAVPSHPFIRILLIAAAFAVATKLTNGRTPFGYIPLPKNGYLPVSLTEEGEEEGRTK